MAYFGRWGLLCPARPADISRRVRLRSTIWRVLLSTLRDVVRVWWVNQGKAPGASDWYRAVWAPLLSEAGKPVWHWDTLNEAQAGDVVIHYARGHLRGLSSVLAEAQPARRPFANTSSWASNGRRLLVDFAEFDIPIPLADLPVELRSGSPGVRSPFSTVGRVNQGYFYPLDLHTATAILEIAAVPVDLTPQDGEGGTLAISGDTDFTALTKRRVEQGLLRKKLLAGQGSAPCGICGVNTDADYLVAAHIKRRASCNDSERRKLDVAMLACQFGCDAAFERGDLRVRDDGTIEVAGASEATRARLLHLEGYPASAFTSGRRRYFRWHRNSF